MKVCMVSTAPPTVCGIANYCMKLVNALCSDESSEFVVLADKRKPPYDVEPVNNRRFKVIRTWTQNSFKYPFEVFRSALSEKPDIIHIQHEYFVFGTYFFSGFFPILLLLLRLLQKPLIVTMHSVIPRSRLTSSFFNRYGLRKKVAPLGKMFLFLVTWATGHFSSTVVVHLRSARATLVNDYKFKHEKVAVIPHGVDANESNSSLHDAREKLNLDYEKIILFFGFVRPCKGIEHLIDAMPRVMDRFSNTTLLIVGNYHPYLTPNGGDYLKLLQNRVRDLKLEDKIFFVSRFVPDEELSLFISACDLVVFPYVEDDILGASGALLSIMDFKKPVIATKVERFLEDIDDGEDGLLVSPGDAYSLSKAIISIFSNPQLGQRVSRKLYNKAKGRYWVNVAQKTLGLYRNSVERSVTSENA